MKYFIAALLMTSSFAMATQCYDDTGAAITIPKGKRIALVSSLARNDQIVVIVEGAVVDLPKANGTVAPATCVKEGDLGFGPGDKPCQ